VDLSGVRDASAVAPTIASSLGVRAAGAGPLDGLVHRLADRELLLVFDNFEQVTDAADVVDRLLHAARAFASW
jgi:predicted ATPase